MKAQQIKIEKLDNIKTENSPKIKTTISKIFSTIFSGRAFTGHTYIFEFKQMKISMGVQLELQISHKTRG